jgi:PAS domain S-box-containing protein
VLLVEDNPGDARLIREALDADPLTAWSIESVERLASAVDAVCRGAVDVVVLDLGLPDSEGLASVEVLRACAPALPIVVLTGIGDARTGVSAVRAGVQDYLTKGEFDSALLGRVLRYAVERGRLASALSASEERYRHLVESSPDIIYRVDELGYFTYASPAALEIMGYSREEVSGKRFLELIRRDYRRAAAEFYARQSLERTPVTYFEFPAIAKDGRQVWIGQKVRLVLEGDRVAGAEAVARDLTERRRADQRLRESEERYRSLFENTPLPAWVYDPETLAVLDVNDVAVEFYGYSRDELLAMTLTQLRAPGGESAPGEPAAGSELPQRQLGSYRRKDGTLVDVEITSHDVRIAGRAARIALAKDLTEERRIERLREDLVNTVVHDLRTPLTCIVGVLDVLEATLENGFRADLLRLARQSSEQLTSLVDSILDVSRLEASALPLERKPVVIAALAAEVLAGAAPVAASRRLQVRNEIPQALPLVSADASLIKRVLQNLVSNATKFTSRGGELAVAARSSEDGSLVEVSVSDSGAGIPKDLEPRLFQKFARGSQHGRGSGLGLAFCRLVVEAHGGRIWAKNRAGKGATFSFTLPIVG